MKKTSKVGSAHIKKRIRQCLVNAGIVFISILIALILVELVYRLFVPSPDIPPMYQRETCYFRNSPDPFQAFEMIPGFTTDTYGERIVINSLGLRSPEIGEKTEGDFRILCIGDSIPFGIGIREEDSYPRQLERMLREEGAINRCDVINTGVPGYNTRNCLAMLRLMVKRLQPDVVNYLFVSNDLDSSLSANGKGFLMFVDPLDEERNTYVLSYMGSVMKNAIRERRHRPESVGGMVSGFLRKASRVYRTIDASFEKTVFHPPFLLYNRNFESKKRWAACEEYLQEMRNICTQSGAKFFVTHFAQRGFSDIIDSVLEEICTGNDITYSSTIDYIESRTWTKQYTLGYDPHPNQRGQRFLAEFLVAVMLQESMIVLQGDIDLREIPEKGFDVGVRTRMLKKLAARYRNCRKEIDLKRGNGVDQIIGGVYSDGWLMKEFIVLLRADSRDDRIVLDCEHSLSKEHSPLTVHLFFEGEEAGTLQIPPGSHQIRYAIPEKFLTMSFPSVIEVRLVSEKVFPSGSHPGEQQYIYPRSFMLHRLAFR